MSVILFIRQGVLVLTALFSIVGLAISAHLISQTELYFDLYGIFCALGVAAGVISLVTLPVMLIVDIMRRGAFTSMIVVEVVWLFVLSILWVATAAEATVANAFFFPLGCILKNTIENGMCQETQAIEAFAFLNFIILLLYVGFLCVIAVMAASRGKSVWVSSVKESFGSPAGPVQHPMTHYSASIPPHYASVPTHATPGTPAVRV